jgi:hypothetical protein
VHAVCNRAEDRTRGDVHRCDKKPFFRYIDPVGADLPATARSEQYLNRDATDLDAPGIEITRVADLLGLPRLAEIVLVISGEVGVIDRHV